MYPQFQKIMLMNHFAVLMEIKSANCLENSSGHCIAFKQTKVDTLDELFDESVFTTFEPGTIDASFFYAAPNIDDAIQPIYDFNQDLFIYHFYNRETMEKDFIQYYWTTRIAQHGACTYEEENNHFTQCSDFEKAWIMKVLNSFLVNYDGRYISYDEFMTQKDTFKETLIQIQSQGIQ